jgi:hypothetical protein
MPAISHVKDSNGLGTEMMHHARRRALAPLLYLAERAGGSEETCFRFRTSCAASRALAVAPPRRTGAFLTRIIVIITMQFLVVVVVKVK